MQTQILIAIDDTQLRGQLAGMLNGHLISSEAADARALSVLANKPIDIAIIDLESPSLNGLELLRNASLKVPSVPVVAIASHHAAKTAIQALKLNTVDHIDKPIDSARLQTAIRRAQGHRQMCVKMNHPVLGLNISGFGGLLGISQAMQEIFDQIQHCAPFKTTVLITGESGTGKDLVARALHLLGPNPQGPFLAINCSAIPRELVESQLFGYEKGAFTGANAMRRGVFEAAHDGTLFLDEIGDLALEAQAKLLRTLEDRQVTRLGSTEPLDIQVRLIAATNTDLKRAVEETRFRKDLYYRLDVLHIKLVPLRERPEDIPILLRTFLDRFAQEHNAIPKILSAEALDCMMDYAWPGNVRELKNIAERLAITSRSDTIDLADLPVEMRLHTPSKSALQTSLNALKGLPLSEIERMVIEHTMEQTGGNRAQTAQTLGISQRTLQRKLKEYNLQW